MKRIILFITCLFAASALTAQAQTKAERIKQIRQAYAEAKQKIEQNGKGANPLRDMIITVSDVRDEEAEVYEDESLTYYFDEGEETGDNGYPALVKRPFFIVENWSCHGHTRYREMLINPKDSTLMFCYIKGETDGGFVVESRFYFDSHGQLIEEKHNTPNTWYSGDAEQADARRFTGLFGMVNCNGYLTSLDLDGQRRPTTPKVQRLKHIRECYAEAKKKAEENRKSDSRRIICITTHDLGTDQPPRTTEVSIYYDWATKQMKPNAVDIGNYCYLITYHCHSMSLDGYGEYLFEPMTNELIFSYTRGREEGTENEWRYYYDENGQCIETKSNSEEVDDGFYDKRAAKDYVKIMKTILEE